MNTKPTILVVAGEFPPLKTIGRLRTLRLVEHLLAQGWRVIVLTVDAPNDHPQYSAALLDEIPNQAEIVRVPLFEPDEALLSWFKRRLSPKTKGSSVTANNISSAPLTTNQQQVSVAKRLIHKGLDYYKALFRYGIYIPDNYRFWARRAYQHSQYCWDQWGIDVIYTTLPPFSSAWLGYQLHRRYGCPWLVDYRDLWYGDVLREWLPRWRQRLELHQERRWIKHAQALVTVSSAKTAFLKKLLPQTNASWHTITNGYDLDLYARLADSPSPFDDEHLHLVYTGRLFKNRRGYALIEALGKIHQQNPALANQLRVHFYGGIEPAIRQHMTQLITTYQHQHLFNFHGDVDYQQAMIAQLHCDWLLLIVDSGQTASGVIPGKLFEYIAAQKPIFALVNAGETQTIIEQGRLGLIAGTQAIDQCHHNLLSLLEHPGQFDPNWQYLGEFDRQCLDARFEQILCRLAHKR